MAKHQITINIVNKQTKEQEKREKLDNALGLGDNLNPSNKLQTKQATKSGKSSSSNTNGDISKVNIAAVSFSAQKLVGNTASTAINLIGSVGDYGVEASKITSAKNLGNRIANIAANSAASGPLWWVTLIFELANWGVEMAENNIQWNHQQQMNNIAAERASNRLGIVATAGNRNMKL